MRIRIETAMTPIITINNSEFNAYDWTERPPNGFAHERHARNLELLENGVDELGPGEVYFRCDQTFAFDTTLQLKGDGRSFVIIASNAGKHVAKPY